MSRHTKTSEALLLQAWEYAFNYANGLSSNGRERAVGALMSLHTHDKATVMQFFAALQTCLQEIHA